MSIRAAETKGRDATVGACLTQDDLLGEEQARETLNVKVRVRGPEVHVRNGLSW